MPCFQHSTLKEYPRVILVILGKDAPGLSASNIVRLKEGWEKQYESWNKRSLVDKRSIYWWVDGVYFNIRLALSA